MAINNFIDRINIGNSANEIAIGSSAYGVCDTGAANAVKAVNIPGFALNTGTTIHVKFTHANTASNPALNVSNTGAINIVQYDTTPAGITDITTGWQDGAILTLTYDGTSWVRDQGYNTDSLLWTYALQTTHPLPLIGASDINTLGNVPTIASGSTPIYGVVPSNGNLQATINPSTGELSVPGGITANIIGNSATATKFNSARTISLLGDIIGSASSDGENGWSINTTLNITVDIARGGTGVTSVNKYGILYGNSDQDAYASTSTGDAGLVIIGGGTSAAPNWYEGLILSGAGTTASPYLATFGGDISIGGGLTLGDSTNWGDEYTPIYWNNGVPGKVTTILRESFTLGTSTMSTAATVSTTITNNTSANSRVIQIVVTDGFSNLHSVIEWQLNSSNQIQLSATTQKVVSGYILYIK